MRKFREVKDRRQELPRLTTVADWEKARAKNLHNGIWACVCGSRKFHLLQHPQNVKAICCKCGNMDIIYWNAAPAESNDKSRGHMLRLDTKTWV